MEFINSLNIFPEHLLFSGTVLDTRIIVVDRTAKDPALMMLIIWGKW